MGLRSRCNHISGWGVQPTHSRDVLTNHATSYVQVKYKLILFEVFSTYTFKRRPRSPRNLVASQASAQLQSGKLRSFHSPHDYYPITHVSSTAGLMHGPCRKGTTVTSSCPCNNGQRIGKSGPDPFSREATRKSLTNAGSMPNADYYLLHRPLNAPLPRLLSIE